MPENGPVAPGFDEHTLESNDDESTGSVILPFGVNFFGSTYNSLFVNNNGNVTFNNSLSDYSPFGLEEYEGQPVIAPFFADVDTRGAGQVSYGDGTYAGRPAFGINYTSVGYYSSHSNLLNTFQLILTDRSDTGAGNFDIYFNYSQIRWETGDADGGQGGFGGVPAAAGFSKGTGEAGTFFQFPGSLMTGKLIDGGPNSLILNTNNDIPGQYLFVVRNGVVTGEVPTSTPTSSGPPLDPAHGVTFVITATGLQREGDTGITPYEVVIERVGNDLVSTSTASWELRIDDPNDLAPDQVYSGVAVFGSGVRTVSVPVGIAGDRVFEEDEWFQFVLTQATHGAETWDPGLVSSGIIVNDDPRVSFQFSGPQLRLEGLAGQAPAEFMVIRGGDLRMPSTVEWRLELGAANAEDFASDQPLTGTITFAAGATQAVIEVQVTGDVRVEPDELFTVRLTSARTGSVTTDLNPRNIVVTGTILDDDGRHSALVANQTALVLPEGDAGATAFNFSLLRIGDLSAAVETPYAITLPGSGGAGAGEIQSPLSGTVSFAAGASEAVLTVLVSGDLLPEDNESFIVTLGGGDLNVLALSGMILNDDKTTVTSTPAAAPAAALPDMSAFMMQLSGGGLWADAGVL